MLYSQITTNNTTATSNNDNDIENNLGNSVL